MTNEDIRKLLGGYATNTLTEAERKTLFDAALEDQELFNALQDEEALKDLLADPVSRAQLQRALEAPVKTRAAWWSGRWAWTGAASAVAAAVIIVGVVRMNAPRGKEQSYSVDGAVAPATQPAQAVVKDREAKPVASTPAASKSAAVEPKNEGRRARADRDVARMAAARPDSKSVPEGAGRTQNEKKEEAASRPAPAPAPGNRMADSIAVEAAPPPPPRPPAAAATQQANVQSQNSGAAGGPSQNAAQNQNTANSVVVQNQLAQNKFRETEAAAASAHLAAQLAEVRAFGKIAVLRYSLVKRDANGGYALVPATDGLNVGDEVRLNVTPIASGFLSLDRVDASGTPVRLFPAAGPGLAVVANTNYTIPNSPIEVLSTDQKFRLNLVSQAVEAATAGRLKQSPSKAKADSGQMLRQRAVAPSVEITIGPKRVP
ncbi:MAG TPA: hypothetical protein VEU96_25390 [Bryobacteraceae bacterium]|nr:hypothetical protein [Bryobacteraceae bacterium]